MSQRSESSAAPPACLLSRSDVAALVDMPAVMEAVRGAFVAQARGEVQMPVKVYLEFEQWRGDLRAMPASVGGVAGVKWINSHPANPSRHGLPTVRGVMLLSDPATANLLAMMDATLITALRTGASAGIATAALARPDARSVGLIGCGVQARFLLDAVRAARPALDDIRVCDADAATAAEFARTCGGQLAPVESVAGCDVVCSATPVRTPFIRREWLQPGAHINAMGADAHGKQEFHVEALRAARVFVDDLAQASGSGEVNVGLVEGTLTTADIAGTLGEVLAGQCAGRENDAQITLFDSTGLAIQDVAVAALVFERARQQGRGQQFDFFA
jgi:alanine dehydrogenase